MPIGINGVEQVVLHAAKHQDTGVDEVSVAALSGLLADDQHVLDAEVTAVAIALTQKAAASGVASLSAASLVVQKPADRLAKANFEITLNKLLKGAGAGADPTEIDVPSGLPSGVIAIWTGTIATIPSGYVICDGLNSTPNLLTKFIEGVATAATNPGATGGDTSKTTSSYAGEYAQSGGGILTSTHSHSISDIRPLFYDVAYIMKT